MFKKCDESGSPKEGSSLRYAIKLDRQMRVHQTSGRVEGLALAGLALALAE